MRKLALPFLLLGAVATSCGDASATFPEDAVAVRASTDMGVGPSRLLVGISTPAGARLGSPEAGIVFEVAPADDPGSVQTVPGIYTWILEDVVGLYRADLEFDRAGIWQVTVVPEVGRPLEPVLFEVFEETLAPALGDLAPLPPTPTLDDGPLQELTSDPDPDPRLYELSLADAVASGRPTVVAFSTPAYCRTAACGPLLEVVKGMIDSYPGTNFVHVEVYTGLTDPDFVPDADHLAPAVREQWYRLPSEPWIFVIDGSGRIAGRFEGVVDRSELDAVLDMISL